MGKRFRTSVFAQAAVAVGTTCIFSFAAAAGIRLIAAEQVAAPVRPGVKERPGEVRVHILCGSTGAPIHLTGRADQAFPEIALVRVDEGVPGDGGVRVADVGTNVVVVPARWRFRLKIGDRLSLNSFTFERAAPSDVWLSCRQLEDQAFVLYETPLGGDVPHQTM